MSISFRCRNSAFTLVELLVSMALIAVVITTATTAFVHMLKTTRRLQAMQTMDATAKATYEDLNRKVTAMHPGSAVWLNSTSSTNSVELVFMHGKMSPYDFPDSKHEYDSGQEMGFTDLLWSRWKWSKSTGILEVGDGRSGRWFLVNGAQARNYWKIPSGSNMRNNYYSSFLSVPQPQRETGTTLSPNTAKDLLNTNSWQSGESNDIGDYDDLLLNARPQLFDCSEFTIELRTVNGSTVTADGTSNLNWAAPGSYLDGRNQSGLGERPTTVRIRFTLTDPATKTSNMYSFSCEAPSINQY
jgi:prepilin-type N-terminal cleavage/methylation domain-containing protein